MARAAETWEETLASTATLSPGWNGYEAPPPTRMAVAIARGIIETVAEKYRIPTTRVAPSAVGGVGITYRGARRRVYVESLNEGRVFALFSDGEDEPVSKEVPLDPAGLDRFLAEMMAYIASTENHRCLC